MKKIYALALFLSCVLYTQSTNAQANSVVLTPPTGPTVSYASITSAYAAIPTNPTGNYLIELLSSYNGTDASEVYPIQLTTKGIVASTPTITIRPVAGNTDEVIQRPTAAAGVVLQFNGSRNVILDGRPGGVTTTATSYLTINDPFVGSNTNRNIEFLNGASNNIAQYLNSIAADANAAGAGSRNILIGSTTTTGNNNNTVAFCNVKGGLRGIQDFGLSDAVPNIGTVIKNNTVSNFSAIGIFAGTAQTNIVIQNNTVSSQSYNVLVAGAVTGIQQQSLVSGISTISDNTISLNLTSTTVTGISGIVDLSAGTNNILRNTISGFSCPSATSITGISANPGINALKIDSNIISNLTGTAATSIIGINCSGTAVINLTISNNKVSNLSSSAAVNIRGMSLFPFAGSVENINNNFVSLTQANTTATAIFGVLIGLTAAGSNYTANVYYNTIRIGGAGSAGATYGINRADNNATSVYNQKNNIVINDRTGGTTTNRHFGFFNGSAAGILSIDYNTYYATAGGTAFSFAAAWITSAFDNAAIAAYKTAATPQEQNSNFVPVSFVSNTDLHLTGTSLSDAALVGTPIVGITTDIDAETRSLTAPRKGADEVSGSLPVTLLSFSGKIKDGYNQLNWSTATELNNTGFELQRSTNGVEFTTLSFVNSKAKEGNSSFRLNYSFDDTKPFATNSFYRLKQVDKDGRSTYSAIINLKGKGVTKLEITNLYPNPVINNFSLVVSTASNSNITVALNDVLGRTLTQQIFGIKTGDNILPINTNALRAGTYIVTVRDNVTGEVSNMKFTKN